MLLRDAVISQSQVTGSHNRSGRDPIDSKLVHLFLIQHQVVFLDGNLLRQIRNLTNHLPCPQARITTKSLSEENQTNRLGKYCQTIGKTTVAGNHREIIAEQERAKKLAEFQAKVEAEKAAAAASTAAYQAKVAEEKAAAEAAAAEAAELAAFKAELAAHEECKAALNLSDSNIALFKTALEAGNLFNVGPQITAGTEFTANRWDDYASCIGALNYKNPF